MHDQNQFIMSATSSPFSKGDGSHRDTPATKLTEFSPEVIRGDNKISSCNVTRVIHPPAFALNRAQGKAHTNPLQGHLTSLAGVQDPFTTNSIIEPTRAGGGLKLSPNAPTFNPLDPCTAHELKATAQSGSVTSAVSYLSAMSVPDTVDNYQMTPKHLLKSGSTTTPPIEAYPA